MDGHIHQSARFNMKSQSRGKPYRTGGRWFGSGSIVEKLYFRGQSGDRLTLRGRKTGSYSSAEGRKSLVRIANKAQRMTISRERETSMGKEYAQFQMLKKKPDAELADLIRASPSNCRITDSNDQHLIHWCAASDKPLSVIAIATTSGGGKELNAKDNRGRTPLHLAVSGELEKMVSLLLSLGARTDILDNSRMMPLHLAARNGYVNMVKTMVEKYTDTNLCGDGGYTAIHFASASDQADTIRVLVTHGASITVRSNNGSYPIHTAAKCGSPKALEALIKGAEKQGMAASVLLNLKDREGQMPIHNAVNNGGAESVIVCLKHGSSLLTMKDNGATPVHSAASQGNLALLKTMHEFDPEAFKQALHTQDYMQRTPLHWAAIFNHESVVKYLLKLSDVNTLDASKLTPVLSAASNACWQTLEVLISHKETNTEVLDINLRNALHLALMQGMNLQGMLPVWKMVRNIRKCCNGEDITGSTPLHYAAWNGDIEDVSALLALGAETHVKNKNRQNPFHLACKNGCHEVCLLLLNQAAGSRLKNEQDGTGQSPLHLAAAKGHFLIVNMLLQRGAIISKDMSVNSPLHLASAGGHIPCVHSLLSVHHDLLDWENMDGNTALHLAASNGHATTVDLLLTSGAEITYNYVGKCFFDDALTSSYREVIEVLIHHQRWNEILSVFSQHHGQLFLGLIRHLPACCLMVLDRCVFESWGDKDNTEYFVKYNFRYLQPGEEYDCFAKIYRLKYTPLLPIELMLEHERDACLRHKLIDVYLKHKWLSYGRMVNFLDVFVYCLYLGALSLFVVTSEPTIHYHEKTTKQRLVTVFKPKTDLESGGLIYEGGQHIIKNYTDDKDFDYRKPWFPREALLYEINPIALIAIVIVITYSVLRILKEIGGMFSLGLESFRDRNLYVQLITFTMSIYFVVPFLWGYSTHTQWQAAAIAIFLAWFNFLVMCRRFDRIGLYLVMYLEIMKTLVQILFIFLVLTVAFGLVFWILHSGREHDISHYSNPIMAMYRTLILVFELDFVVSVLKPYEDGHSATMHFPYLTFFFLALFLLCMPLLLVNLMLGLAVGDIQAVLRRAHQRKLATQVDFHSRIERKLPFLSRLTPEQLTVYPYYSDLSLKAHFLRFIGWKTELIEDDPTNGPIRPFKEASTPAMESLNEVHRELGLIQANLRKVMRRLDIDGEKFTARHDNMDQFSVSFQGISRPLTRKVGNEYTV